MGKTLVLVGHDRAGISHFLHISSPVEYVLSPHALELSISERNRMGYKTFLIPESHSAEIGLGPAYFAKRCPINRLIHIPLAIDQDHMNVIL
jgi:hypothetical protein